MRIMMESSQTLKHHQISENTFYGFSIRKKKPPQHVENIE